jgi:hypothetical protein
MEHVHQADNTIFFNLKTVGSNVQNVQERGGYISGPGTGSIIYTNGSSINFFLAIFKICKYVLLPHKLKSISIYAEKVLWGW